jgi:hypothetical protein
MSEHIRTFPNIGAQGEANNLPNISGYIPPLGGIPPLFGGAVPLVSMFEQASEHGVRTMFAPGIREDDA